MTTRSTRSEAQSRDAKREAEAVERQIQRAFTPEVIDKLRAETGYNPRQRVGTAFRLMLTVVEAFLVGQTLSFTSLRAIFVRRFGFVRPCPFQKRFNVRGRIAIACRPRIDVVRIWGNSRAAIAIRD